MIIDKLMSTNDGVALSSLTVSTQSLKVLDLGAARNNGLFTGTERPGFVVTIKGATSGGASTIAILLKTDDNTAMSSATTLYTGNTLALAAVAGAGTQFFIPMPNSDSHERYLAIQATVGTAVFTGGTVEVEYVADYRQWRAYPAENGR